MNRLFRTFIFGFLALATQGPLAFSQTSERVFYLEVKEAISLATYEYIHRATMEAQNQKIKTLFIAMDTPGGFLEATRDIVQLQLNTESPKIIVWVAPQGARAASAGSMITMAAHYAAMSPSTSIGAATPVSGEGQDIGKDLKKKVENDTIAFVNGIAEKRGRNKQWAEKSVSEAASLTATDALKNQVIDGVHETRESVWAGAQKKFPELSPNPEFVDFPKNLREQVLGFFSNPNIAYGLLSLGALCIYVEITNPGLIIPGTIGALSLALGAITMKIIPIQPGAIGLLILGLVLLGIEILTALPTYGVAGVAGIASLFLSGVFYLDPTQTNLTLSPGLWLPLFFVIVAFMALLGWLAVKALSRTSYAQGSQALIGKMGLVERANTPFEAMILVNGELWKARWKKPEHKKFSQGDKVRIVEQKGLEVFVEEDTTNRDS